MSALDYDYVILNQVLQLMFLWTSSCELFANFMKTQTLNFIRNQFSVWNHCQKVSNRAYVLFVFELDTSQFTHTSTNPLQLSKYFKYSKTSCFYLLCDEQWGTVGLQWESRGREFETNLPPTQPRAYWGANPAYLSPPAKIAYSTTLLRYPIIQNKTDQTTH